MSSLPKLCQIGYKGRVGFTAQANPFPRPIWHGCPRTENHSVPHDVIQMPQQDTGPEALAAEARVAIFKAMQILRDAGEPIEQLIALQARRRPDLLIRAISRFASPPKADIPAGVAQLHLAALRALAAQGAVVIDQVPMSIDEWAA